MIFHEISILAHRILKGQVDFVPFSTLCNDGEQLLVTAYLFGILKPVLERVLALNFPYICLTKNKANLIYHSSHLDSIMKTETLLRRTFQHTARGNENDEVILASLGK